MFCFIFKFYLPDTFVFFPFARRSEHPLQRPPLLPERLPVVPIELQVEVESSSSRSFQQQKQNKKMEDSLTKDPLSIRERRNEPGQLEARD